MITMMKVTKPTRAIPSPPPADDDGPQLNLKGLTMEPVMSMGMGVTMATMRMWMMRKTHRMLMMHQHRIWRTEGIVVETEGIVPESVKIGEYISDL